VTCSSFGLGPSLSSNTNCIATSVCRVLKGFKVGYEKVSKQYPCFGMHHGITNKDWWRLVVQRSFEEAGYFYSKETGESIFERIYSIFGSKVPYEVFDDVVPFLRWARAQGLKTGSLSNAAARYKDQIMPALGIREVSVSLAIILQEFL
jgi:hypothetical protein